MGSGGTIIGDKAARRGLAWLLLAFVLLRSALPVGFMPDLDALQDGRLEIVVCTPSGLKTIALPAETAAPTDEERRSSDGLSDDQCPFHAVVAQAVVIADMPAEAPRPHEAPALPGLRRADVPRAALPGPPVGSRAPPRLIL